MNIVKITKGETFYWVYCDTDDVFYIRHRILSGSELPISFKDLMIGALCEKILNSMEAA
jgi:hypothetical protein